MSFDYDQLKNKENSDGSFWASYSDLFMVLSLVFLLLYVVSGLRSGTNGVKQQIEFKRLQQENADYKEQIKAYNTLKDDYLTQGATKSETKTYEKLMGKLKLLQEEAKDEKDSLTKAARENAEKEQALNQYQQIVRNIINTNMLSAARMKRKTKVIKKIDKSLEEKKAEIKGLNKTVAQKEKEIEKRKEQVKWVEDNLSKTVRKLQKSYKAKKLTKAMMQKKIARLKRKASKQVKNLEAKTQKVKSELASAKSTLSQAQQEIQAKDQKIASQSKDITNLMQQKRETEDQVENLKESFSAQREKAQKAFKAKLQDAQMSARERDRQIKEFRGKLAQEKREHEEKLAGLEGQIEAKQNALSEAQNAAAAAQNKAQAASAKAAGLSKDLKKAQAVINAKKKLIGRIAKNLQKAGLKASVDQNTGDVVLAFGEEYFDTGKAHLKPNMRQMLEKFMPVYSKSLLSDKKTAEKIKSVEVVGFASPTYRGKYVDPVSLKANDRQAASYNLDLSYYRAKSIFDHIFDTKKMKYQYQKDLLPLVKVVGRSFFAEGSDRNIASKMTQKEYCAKYDCKKAQRVIIKFDLEN